MTPSSLTGKMLKVFREKMGLSQAASAEHVGISEGSWVNYESGKRSDRTEPVAIPRMLDWALSAIVGGLRPFSERKDK